MYCLHFLNLMSTCGAPGRPAPDLDAKDAGINTSIIHNLIAWWATSCHVGQVAKETEKAVGGALIIGFVQVC